MNLGGKSPSEPARQCGATLLRVVQAVREPVQYISGNVEFRNIILLDKFASLKSSLPRFDKRTKCGAAAGFQNFKMLLQIFSAVSVKACLYNRIDDRKSRAIFNRFEIFCAFQCVCNRFLGNTKQIRIEVDGKHKCAYSISMTFPFFFFAYRFFTLNNTKSYKARDYSHGPANNRANKTEPLSRGSLKGSIDQRAVDANCCHCGRARNHNSQRPQFARAVFHYLTVPSRACFVERSA